MRDHDRPLAHRGRVASRAIASYIAREHPLPELVITSSATRTLETTQLLIARWKPPPRIVEDSALYLATPREMLNRIHAVVDASVLMLVGHNPGIAELGCLLAGDPAAFGSKFPDSWSCRVPVPSRRLGVCRTGLRPARNLRSTAGSTEAARLK